MINIYQFCILCFYPERWVKSFRDASAFTSAPVFKGVILNRVI